MIGISKQIQRIDMVIAWTLWRTAEHGGSPTQRELIEPKERAGLINAFIVAYLPEGMVRPLSSINRFQQSIDLFRKIGWVQKDSYLPYLKLKKELLNFIGEDPEKWPLSIPVTDLRPEFYRASYPKKVRRES